MVTCRSICDTRGILLQFASLALSWILSGVFLLSLLLNFFCRFLLHSKATKYIHTLHWLGFRIILQSFGFVHIKLRLLSLSTFALALLHKLVFNLLNYILFDWYALVRMTIFSILSQVKLILPIYV